MKVKTSKTGIVKNKVKTKPEKNDPKTTVLIQSNALSTFISAINDCNPETKVHIDENKLRVIQVDIGNVYLLNAECECKTTFEEGSPKHIGIDATLIKKILLHSKGCNVTLVITKSEISITYGRFNSNVPVVDTAFVRKEPNVPELKLETSFEIPIKYLSDACSMVSKGNGKILIYVKDTVIFIEALENDICVREVVGTLDKKSNARSLFSNNYLTLIAKTLKGVSAKFEISVDHPVRISSEKDGCNLQFMLAPRIESD